jgi:hypothetical protein
MNKRRIEGLIAAVLLALPNRYRCSRITRLTDAKRGRDRTDQRAQREHRDRRGGDAAWPEAAVVRKYDVRADFACTASTPRSRAIIGKGVEISVLSNDSIVKAAEIRSGNRRL